MGLGVAAASLGGWLHVQTLAKRDQAELVHANDPAFAEHLDEFRQLRTATLASYVVGGVAIGLGAYLAIRTRRVVIAPVEVSVTGRHATFTIHGEF
jgi:hypothetical protein